MIGVINAEKNRQLLIHHVIPPGRLMISPKCIRQQDNNSQGHEEPCAGEQDVLEMMACPPQSLDLSE